MGAKVWRSPCRGGHAIRSSSDVKLSDRLLVDPNVLFRFPKRQQMRILAHIHTHNEAEFIERALAALLRQTHPPDAIVIVDNLSTDGTLDRNFPESVSVIRNSADLGTTGSVAVGLAHALKEKFDWTWVLDADSVPEPDVLANLLSFFETLPPSDREKVCFLGCRLANASGGEADHHPLLLTASGVERLSADAEVGHCQCDCFIWSGSLFRMPAVAKIGLPSADYVMDLAELEYGYRARQLGLCSYIVFNSVLYQDVGRKPGVMVQIWRLGPLSFRLYEMSALRCYYQVRNMLYFWLYQCRPTRPRWVFRMLVHAVVLSGTFAVRPVTHRRQLIACLRGFWDGVTMRMERRY
jgi:rhamnopyranosyl-N-acetylglucosaminyl-diphospho-decaprenol beta-1,3/1,4-galactofuranosyltransferase